MPESYQLSRRRCLSLCGVTTVVGLSGCLEFADGQQTDGSTQRRENPDQGEENSEQIENETPIDKSTAEPVRDISLTESWRYEEIEENVSGFVALDGGFFAKHWKLPERLLRFESDGANPWESEPLPDIYRFRSHSWNVIDADNEIVYAGTEPPSEALTEEDKEPTGARLYAFNRTDGAIEWYEEVDDESRDRIEYVSLAGDVVVYTADISSSTGPSSILRCVNKATGQRLWSESLPRPVAGLTVTEGRLIVATEQDVSVYEPQSGDKINEFNIAPPEASQANFLAHSAGTVYTYNRTEDTAVALDIQSNEIRWEEPFGPDLSGICTGANTVVLQGRDGVIVAYAADTGERRWTTEVKSTSSHPPRAQKNIIWIDGTETLSAISETGGEVIYEQEFDDDGPRGIATHGETIVFSDGSIAYTVEVS